MNKREKPIPLTVISWMERDVSIRKVSANSRMITNDTRQNIILSRKFFSDLFNLSMERYRKINEHDHNQRVFIQGQMKKSETSLPGLRPHVEKFAFGVNSARQNEQRTARLEQSEFFSPSSQSILSPPESKSDPSFDKISKSRTVSKNEPLQRARSDLISVERAPSVGKIRPLTRGRFHDLAKPKGYREKTSLPHVRPHASLTINPDELIAEESTNSTSEQAVSSLLTGSLTTAVDDRRFRSLFGTFVEKHERPASRFETIQQVIQSNPSLQTVHDRTKKVTQHPAITAQFEFKQRQQFLIHQLQRNFDQFVHGTAA